MRLERNLGMDLVRCTEAAALRAARLMGRGDKNAADQAAVDAMRFALDAVPMDGVVVIGEGEKDEAPMLYIGEKVGTGDPPEVDIAVDPVEGTTLLAEGMPGAIAVVAVAERGSLYHWSGIAYMDKLAVGPQARGASTSMHRLPRTFAMLRGRSIRKSRILRSLCSTGRATKI